MHFVLDVVDGESGSTPSLTMIVSKGDWPPAGCQITKYVANHSQEHIEAGTNDREKHMELYLPIGGLIVQQDLALGNDERPGRQCSEATCKEPHDNPRRL